MSDDSHEPDCALPSPACARPGLLGSRRSQALWLVWAVVIITLFAITWPTKDAKLVRARLVNYEVVKRIGYGAYFFLDVWQTSARRWRRSKLAAIDPAPYRRYLEEIAATRRNPPPGAPRARKHVIFLQLEAIEGQLLGGRRRGRPVMPFMEELAARHVNFAEVQDNTASGRTSDAEFLVLTSAVPPSNPPAFVVQPLDRIPSLPRELGRSGYRSISMHGHRGVFWNRAKAHTSLGFDEMYFEDDLHLSERIGWGWSDNEIFAAAAKKIVESPGPLFVHVISLTSHHPYDYVAKARGIPPGSIAAEYVRSARYVDDCIREFIATLESAGVLDQCLIAIYGDHDSAVTQEVTQYLDPAPAPRIVDRVPLVLVGFDRPAMRVNEVAGLQDLPVMVLEELGLPVPLTFTGNGWNHWGRTVGASSGGCRSTPDGRVEPWQEPVDRGLLTRLSIHHTQKLVGR